MGAGAGTAAAAIGTSVAGAAAGQVVGGLMQGGAGAASAAQQAGYASQALANQMPFIQTGQQMNQQLANEILSGQLGQPFQMTQQQLEQFPGYQFTLQQGLEGVQNAAAARGLGVSGAALKGAAQYATGLANQNYQNAFQDYWANQNNRYSMLAGLSTLGGNVATQAGTQQIQAGQGIGQATAAGLSGLGSGLSNALTTATSGPLLQNLLGGGSTTGSGPGTATYNALAAGGSPQAFQAAYGGAPGTYYP